MAEELSNHGGKNHCNISASSDSQESSEANTVKERVHPNGIDGDESEEDPPEHKPSKLKRRQVPCYLFVSLLGGLEPSM